MAEINYQAPIYGVFFNLLHRDYNILMNVRKSISRLWLARLLIGVVAFLNLQAAVYFLFRPADFAPGFELTGEPGRVIIQGMGLLFVMWNVPYVVALLNPLKHFMSLIEAVVMQAVGVFGETILLLLVKSEHPLIEASVLRFILFDGGGLVLLLVAFCLTLAERRRKNVESLKKVLDEGVN